jgi:hypothetical protein
MRIIHSKKHTFKNPEPGEAVSHGRIGLNSQFQVQKSMLTGKLTLIIGMDIDPFN